MFFGRAKELNTIVQRISGKKPLCISIVGSRRIGKSSLIRFISTSECREKYLFNEGDDFLFVFVDFQHLPYLDDRHFFTYLTKSIIDELSKLKSAIKTQSYQMLVKEAEEIRKADDGFERCELFTGLVENITADSGLKIVFLFDEFENAMLKLSRDVFDYLRTLPSGRNIAYITATKKELQEICENSYTSNFHNIFSVLNLGLFSKEEGVSLIVNPFSKANIQLREDETDSILKMTGLHPFFIHVYCYYLFDVMSGNRNNKSESVNTLFQVDCSPIFKELYSDLSDIEQEMILDIAHERPLTESLNIALLHPKGLVDESGQIFSNSFHDFLLSFGANVKSVQKINQSADSYEDLRLNPEKYVKADEPKKNTTLHPSYLESEIYNIFKSVYQKEREEGASEVNSKTLELLKHKLLDLTASGEEINWLDVGCGDGRCLEVLDAIQNRDDIRYHGIDSSYRYLEDAVERARGYSIATTFDKTNAVAMNFDSEYDVISAVLLLHEVDPLCLPYVLRNMLKALKDDGTLVISDFQGPYEQESDVVAWIAEDITHLLKNIGVTGVSTEFIPSKQYPDDLGFYRCYVKKSRLANERFDKLLQGYGDFLTAKKKVSKQERNKLRVQIEERVRELLNRPDIDLKNLSDEEMQRIRTEIEPEYGIKAYKVRLLVSQIEFLDDKIEEFNGGAGCAGSD
jgi:SAM-dependent methyltransferase/AAA+ ATPase superfamily predicted ATPase